jgi:hypothetical protein
MSDVLGGGGTPGTGGGGELIAVMENK